jgi:ADP-ribosylglycohydrolase
MQAKQKITSDLIENINYAIQNKNRKPIEIAREIGASERVYETIPLAVSCFLHSPKNFEQTVINAANLVPGDTDSIACITGALSGAYNGYRKIPKRIIKGLEDREKIEVLAEKLCDVSLSTIPCA